MGDEDRSVAAFEALPRRVFLDSSALQALQDYGAFVWEHEQPSLSDRIYSIPSGFDEINALRSIFLVNERAMFEFALSEHSLEEVAAKGDRRYLQWAYDVLDHWEACLEGYAGAKVTGRGAALASRLAGPCFGYLSKKDRLLMQDAVMMECEAFLTLDRKLVRNGAHMRQHLDIRVLLPTNYWRLLRPWAALYL
jgi:hypothetical protein